MAEAENGTAAPAAAEAGDAEAWADVERDWLDEKRHLAYLARFHDLDGLAVAGRRYRDVLAVRPEDPVALSFRDEILRRAAAQGLAALPRTMSAGAATRRATRIAVIALALCAAALAVLAVRSLLAFLGARP